MKTRLSLILACIAASLTMSAKQVSADQAIARFKAESNAPAAAKAANAKSIETIFTTDKSAALYLVNSGETTLVLSADDQVKPLLGYFDAPVSGEMPEQLQNWFSEYARQIAYIRTLPEGSCQTEAKAESEDFAPIAPLTSARWGQGAPYNSQCPVINGTQSKTGCVATAVAISLNYFKFPQQATGSIAYTDRYGEHCQMDFSEQSFDWDNLLDSYDGSYTDKQANAIAYLMKACGYASKAAYTETGGGVAYEAAALEPLVNNFGYSDKVAFLLRDNYDSDTWQQLVYNNLKTVGPVIYGGDNSDSGYCFVCDGYSKDGLFHINWGMDGDYNGYFQLSALTPYGTNLHGAITTAYSLNQDAVFNLAPAGHETIDLPDVSPLTWRGNLTVKLTDENTVTLSHDNSHYISSAVTNCSPFDNFFDICLRAFNMSTKEFTILDNVINSYHMTIYEDAGYQPLDSLEFAYDFGLEDLPEGSYSFSPVARVAGTKDWKEIQCGIHNTTSFFVKIDSLGNITDVENDFGENPDIDELSLESPLYMGKPFKYSFDLYNYSDDNMMTAYRPTLLVYDSDSSSFVTIGEGEIVTYDLKPDEDAHLSFVSNMTVTEGYENYTGSVYFALKSVINGQINVYCTTVINEAPTEDVQLVADKFAVSGKAKDLTFDFTVSSKAGYYLDQFVVMVANPDENTVTILYTDDAYSLTAGNAISATVNDTAIHTVGTKYTAGLYYIDKDGKWDLLSELNFTMPGETTSIAAIAANNAISVKANRGEGTISVTAPSAIASVEGFALDGRKVSLSPAISGTAAQAVLPNGLTIIKVTLTDGTTSIAKVIK